ncbi:MAG: hypothetical protein LBD69_04515 [Puniceicoccales bacterium]|jgi:hypothetical protein|nr:hypothetical protein [Puniceicoccales bacterium]
MSSVRSSIAGTASTNQYSAPADDLEKIRVNGYRALGGTPSLNQTVNSLLDNVCIATYDVDMIGGTGFVDTNPNVEQLE